MFKSLTATLLIAAGLISGVANAATLRVATNPTFPPFEFVNRETKEVTGFEMDLIRAMAKQAGYDVEILNIGFDGIIHGRTQEARPLHGPLLQVGPHDPRLQGRRQGRQEL